MGKSGRLTKEQLEEQHRKERELLLHGNQPKGPIRLQEAAATQSPAEAVQALAEAYSADEDLVDLGDALGRPFEMPNGKLVWVHRCTPEQCVMVSVNAARMAVKLYPNPTDPAQRYANTAFGWIWQVIYSVRGGPEADAPQLFKPDHAEALFRNPKPGIETIKQIVALSDEIGRGYGEVGMGEALRGFFGRIERSLRFWSGLLTKDTAEPCAGWLEMLATYTSRIGLQKTFSRSDLADFPIPTEPPDLTPAELPADLTE